ncbi:MAG: hypothetical protein ACRC5H_01820 [Treponemataceae bacterium]
MQTSYTKKNEFLNKLLSVGFGITLFYFSLIYQNRVGIVRLSISFPQIAVFSLFGLFHAFNVFEIKKLINKETTNILDLFFLFFLYTAFYNVVLLPLSGFALIQWGLVILILFSSFISELTGKVLPNVFMGQSPIALLVFGIILFFIKVAIFYMLPPNIYNTIIRGNKTLENIIGVCAIIMLVGGIILLLGQFKTVFSGISNSYPIKKIPNSQNFIAYLGNCVKNIFASIGKLLLLVFSVNILIIGGIIIVLTAGIFIIFIVDNIIQDVLQAVEPFLEKLLSTGEDSIEASTLYGLTQSAVLIALTFYEFMAYKNNKDNLDTKYKTLLIEYFDEEKTIDASKKIQLEAELKEKIMHYSFFTKIQNANSESLQKLGTKIQQEAPQIQANNIQGENNE